MQFSREILRAKQPQFMAEVDYSNVNLGKYDVAKIFVS